MMPPRILIAEDDDIQGSVLRAALLRQGYEADVVPDGLQALRRLRTGTYDLALLDYRLPEIDGLATARLLRDFLSEADRPQLIAVTAAEEELGQRADLAHDTTPFNAVVPKHLGLPALLAAIDTRLTWAAEARAAAVQLRGTAVMAAAVSAHRRRLLAPLAAVPALVMVGGFVAAILWAAASLHHVEAARAAALASEAISADTATLVDAVRDAEISQRNYLLTGGAPPRDAFEAAQQRVDRLLVSPDSLAAGDWPGYGAATRLQGVVEGRLRTLAAEARAWHAPVAGADGAVLSVAAGQETAAWLRQWATGLVERSRQAVFGGLASIRLNISLVLLVLSGGVVYGLWSAVAAVLRRWRGAGAIAGQVPGRADFAPGTPRALSHHAGI